MDIHTDFLVSTVHALCLNLLRHQTPPRHVCGLLARNLRELYELRSQSEVFWKKFSVKAYPTPGVEGTDRGSICTPFEFWRRIDKGVCTTFERGAEGEFDPILMKYGLCLAEACAEMELDAKADTEEAEMVAADKNVIQFRPR